MAPSGAESTVARIVTFDGEPRRAVAGQSVTLVLADEIDVSRGDVIAAADAPPRSGAQVRARLFWSGERPLRPGDGFHVKLASASAGARVEAIRNRIDPDSVAPEPTAMLHPNDIADVTLAFDRPLAFDPYGQNRDTGSFILIDRDSLDTVGIGLVGWPQALPHQFGPPPSPHPEVRAPRVRPSAGPRAGSGEPRRTQPCRCSAPPPVRASRLGLWPRTSA